jgi:hypothetical protein
MVDLQHGIRRTSVRLIAGEEPLGHAGDSVNGSRSSVALAAQRRRVGRTMDRVLPSDDLHGGRPFNTSPQLSELVEFDVLVVLKAPNDDSRLDADLLREL